MTQAILPDDLFTDLEKIERRIKRLENALIPEAIRYIGQTNQPVFAGAWANFDAGISFASVPPTGRPAGFYRHAGHVYLVGLIKSGTSGTVAFTLPTGYRPQVGAGMNRAFNTLASGGMSQITVAPDGAVAIGNVGASNVSTFVYLDGVFFRHA